MISFDEYFEVTSGLLDGRVYLSSILWCLERSCAWFCEVGDFFFPQWEKIIHVIFRKYNSGWEKYIQGSLRSVGTWWLQGLSSNPKMLDYLIEKERVKKKIMIWAQAFCHLHSWTLIFCKAKLGHEMSLGPWHQVFSGSGSPLW